MITGVINQLWTKEVNTKYGEKPVTLFSVEGTEGTFNLGFGKQQVAEGDEVSFNHQDLKYGEYPVDKNTLKIVSRGNKVTAPAATASAPTPGFNSGKGSGKGYSRGNFPLDFTDGQRSILRQHAFTQASELVRWNYEPEDIDSGRLIEEVIEWAYKIERYSSGDDMREEMRKLEDDS